MQRAKLPSEIDLTVFFDVELDHASLADGVLRYELDIGGSLRLEFSVDAPAQAVGVVLRNAEGEVVVRIEREGLTALELFDETPRWLLARFDSDSLTSQLKITLAADPIVEYSTLVD